MGLLSGTALQDIIENRFVLNGLELKDRIPKQRYGTEAVKAIIGMVCNLGLERMTANT